MGLVHHPNVVTDGLIACWDAGNRRSYPGTGLDWIDLAGGANGFITNNGGDAIDFIDEKGGYLDFDGGDDYVACPQPNYDTTGDWSWCMWLNRITSGAPTYPVWYGYGNDPGTRIFWYDAGSGVIKLGLYSQESGNNSSTRPVITTRFPANEWSMFALKKEGNSVYFCVDADEWTEIDRASSNWGSDEFIWRDIGQSLNGYYWHGYIASVHMYNRGISFDEVKQNYEVMKPRFVPRITKSGMFANWDAGDPESYSGGTTWKDTANHYDGTLENDDDGSLTFDSANGGSLVFDGTDDYVGPIAIGDHSSTARSVIIWAAADSYAQSNHEHFTAFNSATDKFSASLGLSNHAGYFYFKSKMTHTSAYQWGIASTSLVAGSWHCWAVTINASDEIVAIYQDGESKTSAHNDGVHLKDDTYIGCRMDGSSVQNPWAGKIGTVRLYTKTLSAAEIMDNFQKTRGRFGV